MLNIWYLATKKDYREETKKNGAWAGNSGCGPLPHLFWKWTGPSRMITMLSPSPPPASKKKKKKKKEKKENEEGKANNKKKQQENEEQYRKIPKISPGAYIFQRPFLRGLSMEGNLLFKIDWASLVVGSKFYLVS